MITELLAKLNRLFPKDRKSIGVNFEVDDRGCMRIEFEVYVANKNVYETLNNIESVARFIDILEKQLELRGYNAKQNVDIQEQAQKVLKDAIAVAEKVVEI